MKLHGQALIRCVMCVSLFTGNRKTRHLKRSHDCSLISSYPHIFIFLFPMPLQPSELKSHIKKPKESTHGISLVGSELQAWYDPSYFCTFSCKNCTYWITCIQRTEMNNSNNLNARLGLGSIKKQCIKCPSSAMYLQQKWCSISLLICVRYQIS